MSKKRKIEIKKVEDRRNYVLWRRVSTQEQAESSLGLDAQVSIAKMFMQKDPIQIFTDVYSGTKLKQCVGLWDAVALCKKEDYLLVIAKSDRFRSVQDALDVLDAVGEKNLMFCDLPTTDRFVLTVMWAMWERQAIMGRVNTQLALNERKRQIAEDGGFFSKSGNWCTHLGNKKGASMKEAHVAGHAMLSQLSQEWRESSPLYSWVTIQLFKRRPRKEILEEARDLYDRNPDKYGTRQGKPLSKGILSVWAKELQMQ